MAYEGPRFLRLLAASKLPKIVLTYALPVFPNFFPFLGFCSVFLARLLSKHQEKVLWSCLVSAENRRSSLMKSASV